ncbi:MAG: polymer-forming cytoskeletal protein [Spirochaetaceae bacterium]|nr:MAG: polymer-forming cytoskeletal protein [Spirochaetaceae bacterium]
MPKNNDHKGIEKITTTLGKETSFNGVLRFKESLKIDGTFEGEIESPGFLYIENGATVKANIKVGSVVVGGVVRGNIEASERLEMLTTGKVFGNIRTAKLNIADGVVFEGKCEMIKNPEKLDIFSAPVANVKKATQSI